MPPPARAAGRGAGLALLLVASSLEAQVQLARDTDRIDITGRQNLTLGSGARAYGMGGAFLARADDATAASWNPAGLSYLRAPEVSLVGVSNSFESQRGTAFDPNAKDFDRFDGSAIDFAAFTWPVGLGETTGAVQVTVTSLPDAWLHTLVGAPELTAGRQGCPRNVPHGGGGAGAAASGMTGSTTFDGCPTECATSLTTDPFAGKSANVQNGRLPPGASTVMRSREPARKTCANGKSATRASTN